MASPSAPDPAPAAAVPALPPRTLLQRIAPLYFHPVQRRWTIQWLPLGVWFLASAISGYTALATGAYVFVKYKRDFTELRYADIFWPHRWKDYRRAHGDYLIERAKQQLQEQRYREAFGGLRIAATKSPGNRDGRIMLAQFLLAVKRGDLAKKHMVEGLDYHAQDLEYLRSLFQFLLQLKEDQEIAAIARRLLPPEASADPRNLLIASAAANAHFARGNFDEAERLVRAYRLDQSKDGRLLLVRIDWESGDRNAAINTLQNLVNQFPNDDDYARQFVAYLRERGSEREAEQFAYFRQLANPANPWPRVELIHALNRRGERVRMEAEIVSYLDDFRANENALLALGDFAANNGYPDLARRVLDTSIPNAAGAKAPGLWLMAVEAAIVARDYPGALDTAGQFEASTPDLDERLKAVLSGLKSIARFGSGDGERAQADLKVFLDQRDIRAENLVAVSTRLLGVGAREQARSIYTRAIAADPLNQAALSGLIRLDLASGRTEGLVANLRTLLTLRKPSPDLLREAVRHLGSDRLMFDTESALLRTELVTYLAKLPPPAAPAGSPAANRPS